MVSTCSKTTNFAAYFLPAMKFWPLWGKLAKNGHDNLAVLACMTRNNKVSLEIHKTGIILANKFITNATVNTAAPWLLSGQSKWDCPKVLNVFYPLLQRSRDRDTTKQTFRKKITLHIHTHTEKFKSNCWVQYTKTNLFDRLKLRLCEIWSCWAILLKLSIL